jgi:hypothetical protein
MERNLEISLVVAVNTLNTGTYFKIIHTDVGNWCRIIVDMLLEHRVLDTH